MDTRRIRSVNLSQIHHLPMIDFIGNDFAIFDDIKDIPFMDFPTRLNAACFAVCSRGWCRFTINLQEQELKAGTMAVILSDQIVQQDGHSDDFSGSFIAVSNDLMEAIIPTMQQLFPMLFMIKDRPCIAITPEELQSFQEYHSFLWRKVKLKDNPFRKEITQGLLLSLFYEIYNIYQGHVALEIMPKSRKEELFERFLRTITEFYKEKRSVNFYADKMCLTAKHLAAVVRGVSGKTASEWIDSLVILEAKALLKSSDMSVQEISDELHFANQSFFGKYFKHHVGVSPKEYRRQ